jgi:biopolymer transport protein ExbD
LVLIERSNPNWKELLNNSLLKLIQENPTQTQATLSVNDDIQFEHIVKVMDYCKAVGYTQLSLAEGTQIPEKNNETL